MKLMDKLTKQNSYLTGIQFKLVPIGRTRQTLLEQGVLEMDEFHEKQIEKIAIILDKFYNAAITEILDAGVDADWESLENSFRTDAYASVRDSVKSQIAKHITKELSAYGNVFSKDFAAKGGLMNFVYSHPEIFEDADYVEEVITNTNRIFSLLTKFYTSRKSMIAGIESDSIANRCLVNFEIWMTNKVQYNDFKEFHMDIASRIEENIDINSMFSSFVPYLSQNGINKFNEYISGIYDDNKKEITKEGYNHFVNKLSQELNESYIKDGVKGKSINIRKFKQLYKQPLSDGKGFHIKAFIDGENFMEALNDFVSNQNKTSIIQNLYSLIMGIKVENTDKIFVSALTLRNISNELIGDWSALEITERKLQTNLYLAENNKKKLTKKDEQIIEKKIKNMEYSFKRIEELILAFVSDDDLYSSLTKKKKLDEYIILKKKLGDGSNFVLDYYKGRIEELKIKYEKASSLINTILNDAYNKKEKDKIKAYVDCFVDAKDITRGFVENDDSDFSFCKNLSSIIDDLKISNEFYNMTRNFVTKIPKDIAKKQKTCLGYTSQYTTGWVVYEGDVITKRDNILLKKDNRYYFARMATKHKLKIYDKPTNHCYEKVMIKKMVPSYQAFPKMMFKNGNDADKIFKDESVSCYFQDFNVSAPFEITRDFYSMYKEQRWKTEYIKFKTNTSEKEKEERIAVYKKDLKAVIEKFMEFIKVSVDFSFYDMSSLKEPDAYENMNQFYNDVDSCTTKMWIAYLDEYEVKMAVKNGDMFLFEMSSQYIRNGRFNDSYSQYLKSLFDTENHKSKSVTLASYPQLFYRPKVIDEKITHKKGSMLVNKNFSDGTKIPDELYREFYAYANGYIDSLSPVSSKLYELATVKPSDYDIIKDKRYTREQFSIMFSIYVNNDVNENVSNNPTYITREYIKDNKNVNVLSVIRGEKNLLYYMVMDGNKNIIEHQSLNVINGVDYQSKLKDKTVERRTDRRNWDKDNGVANIKEGYLHNAITIILAAAKKHNAVICIEDLNDTFKDRRSCLDNQCYSRFKTRIEERMMHYVDKNIKTGENGSITVPYQLASEKYTKAMQNGMLFKINPAYTSNICPFSGFVNVFDLSRIEGIKKETEFLLKFDKIWYDANYRSKNGKEYGRFVFEFDYSNFNTKFDVPKTKWVIGSHTSSYNYDSTNHQIIENSPTKKIKEAFAKAKIEIGEGDIVSNLNSYPGYVVRAIYDAFIQATKMQINKGIKDGEGKILTLEETLISPVISDSYKELNLGTIEESKAYNIALKGLLVLDKIRSDTEKSIIDTAEWISYNQN